MSSPPDPSRAERYARRPLLILLENFVLGCIGALPAERSAQLADVTHRVFGSPPDADWMDVLRTQLELGPTICDGIRDRWERTVATLEAAGQPADPVDFARGIVDANFAPLIDANPGPA